MITELGRWFSDLNLELLRVTRPSKFLFLCGGARETRPKARAANLRDYILRVRPFRTPHTIVLAEEATQLYRDTAYDDLITFEEDIARIAAVVLVIAESAGSLAELGAFTANDTIRESLRVVIPRHHETAESFVRYGPIQRLKNEKRGKLGVYPWTVHAKGGLNVSSIRPHYGSLVSFIRDNLDNTPISIPYKNLNESRLFYIVYWIIYVSVAITPSLLYECVRIIEPTADDKQIRNKVYCLQLAKWIERYSYSDNDYFFTRFSDEPFVYRYKAGFADTSNIRRKLAVADALKKIHPIPRYVSRIANEARGLAT
ncbi:retron St85 family effector protein [Mesorhizobium sp. CA14]|uniref:retron St85 family effector protein n=1 Tax=Mesorhizobium sp. CA14 TaxID=2876642 RepID=UPI001CCEE6EC|nr:retron St85 family effector protein [Mesorhizobium sp. CA14]MBZ9850151.1 retron St85 family effector protein [Mesorhizobium sp. CA14]